MYVYDVWATVYPPPLPPLASPTISMQPTAIETLPAGPPFFVEVYAQDVTDFAGYQLTINFNTTVLSTVIAGAWSYYPFTDVAVMDASDLLGYVSIATSIPITDPLVTTGVTGNLVLARVYFQVDTGMTASDYSFLTFSVSILGNPAAQPMPHSEYHGLYGAPPPTTHVAGWIPTSEFPWDEPVCTHWVEIYPDVGTEWHLTSVEEPFDPPLRPSYQIDMTMEEPPTGEVWWFHVDEILESDTDGDAINDAVYMILTFKYKEGPEFPLGVGLMMALVPAIPIVYLWRLRKKVVKN